MDENVYKVVEIVGSSATGIEDAVHNAVQQTGHNVRHMRWFQVTDTRGHLDDGAVVHWQVTVKIGFTMETER